MEVLLNDELISMKEVLQNHKKYLHDNAEDGFKEFKTAKYISNVLKELGYEVEEGVAGTGVVGVLRGNYSSDECLLFRSEMDALPIRSDYGTEKFSHVCGHDAHMAINLTLAEIISKNKEKLKGSIKFIFQPAEEKMNGAIEMIKAGILENPKVTKGFALHAWSEFPVGQIALSDNYVMAGGDEFDIKVLGDGGHAAMPNKSVDTIVIASMIIGLIQSIVSRNIDPSQAGVVTIGTINGGESKNAIADMTRMSGTCRYFDKETQERIFQRLNSIVSNMAKGFNSKIELDYIKNVPPITNTKEIADKLTIIANEVFGIDNVKGDYKCLCVDDFAFYLERIEGCYIMLGAREKEYYPQHNPNYYVPIKTMELGLELEYEICRKYILE